MMLAYTWTVYKLRIIEANETWRFARSSIAHQMFSVLQYNVFLPVVFISNILYFKIFWRIFIIFFTISICVYIHVYYLGMHDIDSVICSNFYATTSDRSVALINNHIL